MKVDHRDEHSLSASMEFRMLLEDVQLLKRFDGRYSIDPNRRTKSSPILFDNECGD